ncbi:MAG TPA: methyltransferase domain-containing protein, partial [Ktedonobacteraceae bacterium]|nr:methyltransferase domain-containing protein [Ktedonobacteraceae bacterium]
MEPVDGGNDATLREALINRLKGQGVIHTREVEEALRAVPRHLFVPEVDVETAYSDAYVVTKWKDGQAISSSSQPHIMAMMLEMLDLRPGQRVLEIGAGTGYNAALMAHIVGESGRVVTIDLDEDIVEGARKHLSDAGVENVQVVCNDGGLGWEEAMRYDRVILTVGS